MKYRINDILFDRYRVDALLGAGAYAQVYLVTHMNLGVQRAIKCIFRQPDLALAREEADILKNLRHPAIPIIYDIEETNEGVGIIEEYVQGKSLDSYLYPKNTISYREVIQYAEQLCEVVLYLHRQGVCHHDIKPENIRIDEGRLKLLDYGSAVYQSEEAEDSLHRGTLWYAAPEMYERTKTGESADIYSIGMVILAMAGGDTSTQALTNLRPELASIVRRCICHARSERYGSLAQLLKALQEAGHNTTPVSYHYHFVGITPHCGTTKAAILTARELTRRGHKPLLEERNEHDDFRAIVREADRITFRAGIVEADGIAYLPNYRGGAIPTIPDCYDYRLYDEGVLSGENYQRVSEDGITCLVCTAAPYDLTRLAEWLCDPRLGIQHRPENFRIMLNLCSASQYKKAVRDLGLVNPVRVAYSP